MQRALMAGVAVLAGVYLLGPRPLASGGLGQGRGGGQGNGGLCVDDEFPAEVLFTGSITSSNATIPVVTARFHHGNIGGEVENGNALPVTLLFPPGHRTANYPAPVQDGTVDVDPWVSTGAYEDSDAVTSLECGMLGMVPGVPYRMRLALRWYENLSDGQPAPLGESTELQSEWFLRWRPTLLPDEQLTYLDAVRTDANSWLLSTRTDSIPADFGSLERSATGRGKDKVARIYTTPSMPFGAMITVDCGGDCPVPATTIAQASSVTSASATSGPSDCGPRGLMSGWGARPASACARPTTDPAR